MSDAARDRRILARIIEEQRGKCYLCRKPFDAASATRHATIDHRLPLCRGGENRLVNLAAAHWDCNLDKGPLTEQEYRDAQAAGVVKDIRDLAHRMLSDRAALTRRVRALTDRDAAWEEWEGMRRV